MGVVRVDGMLVSWSKIGEETSTTGAVFAIYRCKVCKRQCVTCGSEPHSPCVCSPGPRHGAANKGRIRRK